MSALNRRALITTGAASVLGAGALILAGCTPTANTGGANSGKGVVAA